jgi:Tfp pilus tip-associated adhesin PilY1
MKRIVCIAIIAGLYCCLSTLGHAASGPRMTDYCATPPFLVQATPPNIMIVIDMSGSMQFPAHIPDNWDSGGGHYDNQVAQVPLLSGNYDGTKEYYGYFKTDKFYQYSNTFIENGDCTQAQWADPTSWNSTHIPGNLLNWIAMSRVDILRKVLIGGKSVAHISNTHTLLSEGGTWTYTDTNLSCQFSVSGGTNQAHTISVSSSGGTCPFTLSGANVKVDLPEAERVGVVQQISDRDNDGAWDTGAPRFGLMVYSSSDNNRGRIVDGCDTQNTTASSFMNDLQTELPYNGTPTGEAIINALDYFKHTKSTCTYYPNNSYMGSSKDPWMASCQLSFILLISDGQWDNSVDGVDPVVPALQGRIGTFDGSSHDLRTDFDGSQVVTTYTVYAFEGLSGGKNALQQTAIYGGFVDKDADYWPFPYTAYPTDSRTVTLPNSSCNPTGTWDEHCLEWDESRDGIPDNYYEAKEGSDLEDKITAAIYDMMRRASSGTSVSVLSTSAEGEGSLFQAYFNYKVASEGTLRTVYWVGYLNGLWIDQYGNIREDTVQDQALILTEDYIIQFFVDSDGVTKVKRYHDIDGDGAIDTGEYVDTVTIADLKPIWEGGKKLALRDDTSTPRTLYTWVDVNNNGVKDSGEFGSNKFVTSEAATLKPYLNAADTGTFTATHIIQFIRGQYVTGMRERRLTIDGQADKVWKLSDITYSTPVAVGAPMMKYHIIYGDATYHEYYTQYKNRRVVVYAGANDGMLHAFNAGFYHEGDDSSTSDKHERGYYTDPADSKANNADIGKELWAYIPYNLLPHLQWLASTSYCHVYYVDLKPKVLDARIFTPDSTHPNGWGTILIGGMRLGGGQLSLRKDFGSGTQTRLFRSAYFALDITDPLNPVLLWEYWDKADTTNTNLGFTTSYPTVLRVGPSDQAGSWYLIFGSGVATGTGTQAGDGSTATRYVYILDLKTGSLVRKVDMAGVDSEISGKKVFMADPITVDLGVDYQVDKGYIGATYYNSGWLGKMYRININEDTTVNNWTFSTFMSLPKPVTAAPSAAVDLYDRLWVYFGTGRYFNDADRIDTSNQYLYGVWDPGTGSVSGLDDVTNIHVYENKYVYNNTTYVSAFNQYLAARRNDYSSATSHGWYLTMTGGERSLNKPTILGGIVLFPTFKPTTDACSYGGSSYLYGLYYETGTANDESVIGLGTGIDIGGTTYQEILKKADLGSGMPTNAVIHSGQEQGVMSLIQLGTGVIKQITVEPAFSPKSQTLFWEERR